MSPNQTGDYVPLGKWDKHCVFLKLLSDFPVSLLMCNMFVVTLTPCKSHCYFFTYLPCKKYRPSKSKRTYIFETVISCMHNNYSTKT